MPPPPRSAAPSETPTRYSRSTTRSTAAGSSSSGLVKPRSYSSASLSSNISGVTTIVPDRKSTSGSPKNADTTATAPQARPPNMVRRLSTVKSTTMRRSSNATPPTSFLDPNLSTSSLSSSLSKSTTTPSRQNSVPMPRQSSAPSVAASRRSVRSSALSLYTSESDTQVNGKMVPATPRTRAMSTPFTASQAKIKSPAKSPARSPGPSPLSPPENAKPVMATPKTTPSKAASTTPKTTPSRPQRTPTKPSPKVTPSKASTPGRTVRNDGSPNNLRHRQASGSVAESPSIMLTSEDEPFWDGDDMTLEMVTDVNDGEVDEDVSPALGSSHGFITQSCVSCCRCKVRWRASMASTCASCCTTSDCWNVLRHRRLRSCTRYKRRCVCCANASGNRSKAA